MNLVDKKIRAVPAIVVGISATVFVLVHRLQSSLLFVTSILAISGLIEWNWDILVERWGKLEFLDNNPEFPRSILQSTIQNRFSTLISSTTFFNTTASRELTTNLGYLVAAPIIILLVLSSKNLGNEIGVQRFQIAFQGVGSLFLGLGEFGMTYESARERFGGRQDTLSDEQFLKLASAKSVGFCLLAIGFMISALNISSNIEVYLPKNEIVQSVILLISIFLLLIIGGFRMIVGTILFYIYLISSVFLLVGLYSVTTGWVFLVASFLILSSGVLLFLRF